MFQTERVRRRLTRKMLPVQLSTLGTAGFEGYASVFGASDGAGDVVAPGAFAASLRRRGPREVRMLYQHFAYEPIGVWEVIREDAHGLYVKGSLVTEVERARDVAALLRAGALGGLSIGFKTVRARREPSGARTLLQVDLWEISVVTFPLLEAANVTAVGKGNGEFGRRLRLAAAQMRAS